MSSYSVKNKFTTCIFLAVPDVTTVIEQDMNGHKEWKEGIDCVKVEPSIVCHDGESIQVNI